MIQARTIALLVGGILSMAASVEVRCADDVTIYRCTDGHGHVSLRDTPCSPDQHQQSRNMLRPKDAPPAEVQRARTPPRSRIAAPAPETRVVVINPPRPLYECVTPDGGRYTSDTNEGNPRWVPLWTLGYPVRGRRTVPGSGDLAITDGSVHIDNSHAVLTTPYRGFAYGTGTWVRDVCHALPQAEVCARLRDRRDAIRTRFFNAMPNERDVLRVEERGVIARLDDDCGGH